MNVKVERDAEGNAPAWLVWAALWVVYIVWGSTYLAIRVMVETIPPLLSSGIRFLTAGLIVYTVLLIKRGRAGVRVTPQQLLYCFLVGTALFLGANGAVAVGELEVPSSLAALIISSVPLWVIILRALSGDRVSLGTFIGVLAGFSGVAVLVVPGDRPGDATWWGIGLIIFASISWAIGSFWSTRFKMPKDLMVSSTYQMIGGGLAMIVAGLIRGEANGFEASDWSGASIVAFFYLVFFGSLLAFTAYAWLLQNAPISQVATYAYVNPVVAIILGSVILNEEISSNTLIGAAVIVASVAFIVRKEAKPRRASESAPAVLGADPV